MGRPNLSRDTKFSGANGDREKSFFPVHLTTSRIGNLITRLVHTLLEEMTIHTLVIYAVLFIFHSKSIQN